MKETFTIAGKDYEFEIHQHEEKDSVIVTVDGHHALEFIPHKGVRPTRYFHSEDFPYDEHREGRIMIFED